MSAMLSNLSWEAYIKGHPERLPRGAEGKTWGDTPRNERRRVLRNFRRWRERRIAWARGRPLNFKVEGNVLLVETYEGWRHA